MKRASGEFDAFPLPASIAREVDRLCVEFESAWRRGDRPDLSDFVCRLPERGRTVGAELLLEIELDARRSRGESVVSADYASVLDIEPTEFDAIWSRAVQATQSPAQHDGRVFPLPDRFELLESLGSGGMGEVFRARHRHLNRIVAVKVLRERLSDVPSAIERFQSEIQLLASLQHPGIASALDADFVDGFGVLVLEFVEGTDLHRLVQQEGPLPVPAALRIARELAEALQYAHDHGVVHRDVKPANVMLTSSGRVKLLDLGIAQLSSADMVPASVRRSTGAVCGTPEFAAPEQMSGEGVDGRADIYSLGCTLFHILTGSPPEARTGFANPTTADKTPSHRRTTLPKTGIPPKVESLLAALTAEDPKERPAEMRDVIARLDELLAESASRKTRRRVAVVAASILLVGLVIVLNASQLAAILGSRPRDVVLNSIGMALIETSLPRTDSVSGEEDQLRPLLVSSHEVTRRQFQRVMEREAAANDLDNAPRTSVSWHDAQEFCRRLSERVEERQSGYRYRLPLESEWLAIAQALGENGQGKDDGSESARRTADLNPTEDELKASLRNAVWEWCDDGREADAIQDDETAPPMGLPARQQKPISGPVGLFVHNFDLWDDYRQYLHEIEGIRLREESDGRTRYLEPAAPRRDGRIVYQYEFSTPVIEAKLFAKILAHRPTSSAWLEISTDGDQWTAVDEGYLSNSHESPRDVSAAFRGSRRLWVRLRLREDSEETFQSQALRTSPNPDFQSPNVYQLIVVTQHQPDLPNRRVLAPASLKHEVVGFRVICERRSRSLIKE